MPSPQPAIADPASSQAPSALPVRPDPLRAPLRVPPRWPLIRLFIWLCTIPASALVLSSLLYPHSLDSSDDLPMLLSHAAFMGRVFALHLGIALAVAAAIAILARARRLLTLAAASSIISLAPLAPVFFKASPAPLAPTETALTVMSINLLYGEADAAVTLAEIARIDPDVILFQEWTPLAEARFSQALAARYPHNCSLTLDGGFGQASFSRLPCLETPRKFPARPPASTGFNWTEKQIRVVVDAAPSSAPAPVPVIIYNIHTIPPSGRTFIRTQRRQTLALAELARTELAAATDAAPRVIFAGDFNATYNTAHLAAMHSAGLTDALAAAAPGRPSSWPRTTFLRFFPGIRIDHILASVPLRPIAAGTAKDTGSDHRPVWSRFAIKIPPSHPAIP